MDQTFDKQKVVLAATRAIAWVKVERAKRIAAYNAQSGFVKFCAEYGVGGETLYSAEHYDQRRVEAAERLIFKATNCEDSIVFMSNEEIDQTRDFWKA
jgi:hypothetical protein